LKTEVAAARARIQAAASIAIFSHIRPDGDAVGSLLGLGLALASQGKQVAMVLADGLPSRFRFLPGSDAIRTRAGAADLTVAVDCSTRERLGLPPNGPGGVDLNIDHHISNTRFGAIDLIDPEATATAEMLFALAGPLGLTVDTQVATCLLTGLVTDTIGFRTSNVTPRVLRMAAELMELGAPLSEVYDRGLNRRPLHAARYWGCGLARLEREDGLVWACLTAEDRARTGYPGLDDADLINVISALDEAELAVVLVEQPAGMVKVSWRSRGPLDVSRLAREFGGGGHEPAAGAMIEGTLEGVTSAVLAASRRLIQGAPGKTP
jgi:phosphoesterase RecJ-like protein